MAPIQIQNKEENQPDKNYQKGGSTKRLLIGLIVLVLLASGFVGGILFEKSRSDDIARGLLPLINTELGKPDSVDFKMFWDAWNLIHEKYADKEDLDTQKMVFGAIQGMVDAIGDPFTNFFEPESNKKFQEEISGEFIGVGIEIGTRNNQLTVISPIKDTPADKAGVKAGDKILKINDKDTIGVSLQEAVSLIRGKRGTPVTLSISRKNLEEIKNITIIRDTIKIPTITLSFIGENKKITHLQIHSFNQNVDDDFTKAARAILSSESDRIILDLRNNPGGLLESSVFIASWFLNDKETVTTEKFGDGKEVPFLAKNIGSLKNLPMVVLVNQGSASASEILAGAIADNRSIKIVGEKTFGKGSVQEVFGIGKNTSLKITIAKWLTPNGLSINDEGITPDITVEMSEEDLENNADPQLEKAVEEVLKL